MVFTYNHGFLGSGEGWRKHWKKEENGKKKQIQKFKNDEKEKRII